MRPKKKMDLFFGTADMLFFGLLRLASSSSVREAFISLDDWEATFGYVIIIGSIGSGRLV